MPWPILFLLAHSAHCQRRIEPPRPCLTGMQDTVAPIACHGVGRVAYAPKHGSRPRWCRIRCHTYTLTGVRYIDRQEQCPDPDRGARLQAIRRGVRGLHPNCSYQAQEGEPDE